MFVDFAYKEHDVSCLLSVTSCDKTEPWVIQALGGQEILKLPGKTEELLPGIMCCHMGALDSHLEACSGVCVCTCQLCLICRWGRIFGK